MAMEELTKFKKIQDKKILDKVLKFRNHMVSSIDERLFYVNIDYLKNNDLILYPTYRIYDGEYEFGRLADLLQKNNFTYIYVLLLNKYKEIKIKDYVEACKKAGDQDEAKSYENCKYEYMTIVEVNTTDNIEVYKISLNEIMPFFEVRLIMDAVMFTSTDFDFFILSTWFDYDLICGKKEIVNNFVKMTNRRCLKKLKELDEMIEDPIRLYDIYGDYFQETKAKK